MPRFLLPALMLAAATASADVYRCTGPDGSTTFSQTPCSQSAERVAVESARPAARTSVDCRVAEPFARAVAKLMRQGLSKDETIAEFGGPQALRPGAERLVDYVYLYRDSRGMTQDRMVALTMAQCESGSLGDVSCAALPSGYTDAGGGCGGEFSAYDAEPQVDVFARNRARSEVRTREAAALQAEQSAKLQEDYARRERVRQCREKIQHEINLVEIQIQAGADPNSHRRTLQRLRADQKACR